jgi:hypothetical protein
MGHVYFAATEATSSCSVSMSPSFSSRQREIRRYISFLYTISGVVLDLELMGNPGTMREVFTYSGDFA